VYIGEPRPRRVAAEVRRAVRDTAACRTPTRTGDPGAPLPGDPRTRALVFLQQRQRTVIHSFDYIHTHTHIHTRTHSALKYILENKTNTRVVKTGEKKKKKKKKKKKTPRLGAVTPGPLAFLTSSLCDPKGWGDNPTNNNTKIIIIIIITNTNQGIININTVKPLGGRQST
jgi:hypothetical protein